MITLKSTAGTMGLDERWPRVLWYESPDGRTRIPGERETIGPRVYIFRKRDRAQLTSDADNVRVEYDLRASDTEAVYSARVTCDGLPAVAMEVCFRLRGADATICFENVREYPGFCFLSLRLARVVAASSVDGDGRVVTGHTQGRLLDPAKCKPCLTDYSWHGAIARPCGAAYRDRFMVTFDLPGYEDLFVNEVRSATRIATAETLASLGGEMMYRQRTVENVAAAMPHPEAANIPAIAVLDEPLRCTGPKEIRLHFVRSRGGRKLDWTDAARHFQALVPKNRHCEPLYDDALVYKTVLAWINQPVNSVDQALAAIRRVHYLTDGMKQVCYWVGFQHIGHDSGWPDVFTVYPLVGDKADLRRGIREAREKYGANVSFHLNVDVFSDTSPLLDGRYLTRDSLGRVSGQGNWGGNLLYGLCIPAYRRQLAGIIARVVREYGIRDTVHLDTFNGGPYTYCATPDHPYSAYDLTQAKIDFLDEFHRNGLDVTSECLTDPYVGHIGHTWALFNYGTNWEGAEKIPFTNFIYHGATSYNAGHGNIPLAYFADKPGLDDTILGMLVEGGGVGLECLASEEGMAKTLEDVVALLYLVQPPYAMLRHRKWSACRRHGTGYRVDYGPGSHIAVDPAKPGYEVVVDGRLIARDFVTVFPGPKPNTLLAFSRAAHDLDWPVPEGWGDGSLLGQILTEDGPGVKVNAEIKGGRLHVKLPANRPVRFTMPRVTQAKRKAERPRRALGA
jgi:hypothetical protein